MALKIFDRKFGREFIQELPISPGVYRVFDKQDSLVYVGKAKNLKRRLAQYRNAKRRKKHRKMREIVRDASRIEFDICASDLDACLLENRLIQKYRPKWNIAGAFHFLYPLLGVRRVGSDTFFCYTTQPHLFLEYRMHGCYRSRKLTRGAFFSLMRLLEFMGHRIPQRKIGQVARYSYVLGFRQLPESWVERLEGFFRAETRQALEDLILSLVENASARQQRKSVQQLFQDLDRFWRHEAQPLAAAVRAVNWQAYPIEQADRDSVFLMYRMGECSISMRPKFQTRFVPEAAADVRTPLLQSASDGKN